MPSKLRVAAAGTPGAWSTERLEEALAGAGAETFAFSLADCTFSMTEGAVMLGDQDLGTLDGLVVKKLGRSSEAAAPSRVQLLQQLEFRGVRVFSPADGIREVNDRYQMTQRLAQAGVPLPRTVVTESVEAATDVVEAWGRVVVKPLYTSKGRGMLSLAREDAYRLKLRQWQRRWETPFYLQEYVPHPGRDIGVVVLGGESPGAYYRVARPGSWLTTTSAEGHYERCELSPEMRRLACLAADLFGLDFTVVDLVEVRGGFLIYEVSAFGGFAGLWQTHGIDAARLYADHVVRTLGASGR